MRCEDEMRRMKCERMRYEDECGRVRYEDEIRRMGCEMMRCEDKYDGLFTTRTNDD